MVRHSDSDLGGLGSIPRNVGFFREREREREREIASKQ